MIFMSGRSNRDYHFPEYVQNMLSASGYRVFWDNTALRSGPFDETMYRFIDQSTDVILFLTARCMDHCNDPEDWLRKEIAYAMDHGKNIIPVLMRGFSWPDNLPFEIRELEFYRNIEFLPYMVDEYIRLLTNEFLTGRPEKNPDPIPAADRRPVAFISYSSKQADIAGIVRETLKNNRISCWMAPESIPPGSDYAAEIQDALENCKVFVLLLSEESQRSVWVAKELDQAISLGKTVFPLHIDQSILQKAFVFRLTNIQQLDAVSDLLGSIMTVVNIIHRITFNISTPWNR